MFGHNKETAKKLIVTAASGKEAERQKKKKESLKKELKEIRDAAKNYEGVAGKQTAFFKSLQKEKLKKPTTKRRSLGSIGELNSVIEFSEVETLEKTAEKETSEQTQEAPSTAPTRRRKKAHSFSLIQEPSFTEIKEEAPTLPTPRNL